MNTSDYDELRWKSAPPLDASEELHAAASSPNRTSALMSSSSDSSSAVVVDSSLASSASAAAPSSTEQPSPPSSSTDDNNNNNFLPLHAERTALLIVDVQPEYWSQCPAVRQDFCNFPKHLQATVDICRRQTVAKIIWVRADYRYSHSPWLKQFARLHGLESSSRHDAPTTNNKNNSSMRAEVPCDPTSHDFAWEDFATPAGGDVIIPKSSWSSTSNTALMDVLQAANVDTVLVCGLITSVCVQHSAFGIFEAGYRTVLVTDACADRGQARHDAALALYGDYMYELLTSQDLACPTSPRRLRAAQPLWVLPTTENDEQQQEHHQQQQQQPKVVYSPVFSSQLPPPCGALLPAGADAGLRSSSSTLSTSTSQTSLSSAGIHQTTTTTQNNAANAAALMEPMPPLQI